MQDDQPTGPSPETLKNLAGMLPSFVKGLEEKRSIGRGTPVHLKPRKMCKVCGRMWDKVSTKEDVLLEGAVCETCAAMFKDGCVALVCGDQFAFAKSESLKDLAGEIITIQPHNFEKIQKQFEAEWKKKEIPDDIREDSSGAV